VRPAPAGLLQCGGFLQSRPSRPDARAHSASLLLHAHPALLAPAHRARRPPGRAKSGTASDDGGGGASEALAPTRRLESPGPKLPHVANVCFKCFRYFVGMFQVFYADVAKVD
jgi:hypothetical protein